MERVCDIEVSGGERWAFVTRYDRFGSLSLRELQIIDLTKGILHRNLPLNGVANLEPEGWDSAKLKLAVGYSDHRRANTFGIDLLECGATDVEIWTAHSEADCWGMFLPKFWSPDGAAFAFVSCHGSSPEIRRRLIHVEVAGRTPKAHTGDWENITSEARIRWIGNRPELYVPDRPE